MATEFIMPKLGLTMEEGTILEWLVAHGDQIQPGTPVLRIETDKVESDVESSTAGRIHLSGEIGQSYPCGAVIGYVLAEGEAPPQSTSSSSNPVRAHDDKIQAPAATSQQRELARTDQPVDQNGRRFISPNAYRIAATLGVDLTTVTGSGPNGRIVSEDVEEAATRQPIPVENIASSATAQTSATAAARQLADLLGIDLRQVPHAPGQSRIERDDVAAYVRQRLARLSESGVATTTSSSATGSGVKKMSAMRNTIAKRMHASLQEMAQLTLHMDADFDEVIDHRDGQRHNEVTPGLTDYVLAAAGRALSQHRYVNSHIVDGGLAEIPDIHIGLAVAVPGGLVVPVIRHCDRKSLFDIARDSKRLATSAREGRMQLEDLEGGTFSVTALGMYGVDGFTPVINPPNAAILGVGRLRDDVVVKKKGKVSTVKRLTLSLTWDHRVFDGAPAAEFCRTVVELLQDPDSLC